MKYITSVPFRLYQTVPLHMIDPPSESNPHLNQTKTPHYFSQILVPCSTKNATAELIKCYQNAFLIKQMQKDR